MHPMMDQARKKNASPDWLTPPVWVGARGEIVFWLTKTFPDCDDGPAVVAEFDEAQNSHKQILSK